MRADIAFLKSHNLMDYSMLVGLENNVLGESKYGNRPKDQANLMKASQAFKKGFYNKSLQFGNLSRIPTFETSSTG
jgi:hypothetical protein